jgi:hypothetical protein
MYVLYQYDQGPMLCFLKYFRLKIWRKLLTFFGSKYCITTATQRQFFRQNLSKIAENCDHKIDP